MKGGSQADSKQGHLRWQERAGFTVVEVMIVLAVTGLLFVSAATLISGKQNQAAFEQGMQQLQSQMEQVINDVAAGFYPNLNNFSCKRSGSNLTISGTVAAQGTNGDCLFLGKTVRFGSGVTGSTSPEQFATFSLTGLRADASGNQIMTLANAVATVIPTSTTTTQLEGGLTTAGMWYNNNKANKISALAFVSTLGQVNGSGVLTGTQQVNIIPITNTTLTQTTTTTISRTQTVLRSAAAIVNPSGGVEICFASGGTNQSGLITIGNNGTSNRELGVTLAIKAGSSC